MKTNLNKMSVLILAAGQGRRMKSDLPKVLQPLAGKPLLRHVVETARCLNADTIHVVYGHGGEQVRAAFANDALHWALQAEQKGTGHAVMQAMPQVPDDHLVLVLYGDVPLINLQTLQQLIALAGPHVMSLLTVMLDDPTGYGRIIRDRRGQVRGIVEQKDASKTQLKIREGNTGVLAVRAGLLRRWLGKLRSNNAQGEYYLTDVVAMAARDKVKVVPLLAPTMGEVLGVNDKVQLAEIEALYRAQQARELMLAGVTLHDPARIDVRGEVTAGRDVELDVNVVLLGRVVLGDRVRIGANCVIRDSSIGADTIVQPNCVIEHAEVGERCEVGPFSRLRPQAKLHSDVHIGNFVEIKKSEIGAGSKANHLSYIGDALVGRNVNFGAGTITCNYDGANKWVTTVEDDVHTGSDTMLVAPVRLGKGSTTGAGSTITKDVLAGELAVARAKQLAIPGWKRPVKQKK